MNLHDGYTQVLDAALRGGLPNPPLEIDKWAEEHIVLPRGLAAKHGRYEIATTPMARRVMQVLSPGHPAKRVVVRCAIQMFKTQVAINFVLASAHQAPDAILVLEPTNDLVKRVSARIDKTIELSPALRGTFSPRRSRDSRNTVHTKDFMGGTLHIYTAGSAGNVSEMPIRYIVIDEVDMLEADLASMGDPVLSAEGRASTHEDDAKFLEIGKPTIAGASKIQEQFELGTQEVYLVPCPHCGHHHELVLENFHFRRDEETGHMLRAWFVCPECGAEIDERHKTTMLPGPEEGGTAHWAPRSGGDGETVSFTCSAFYAQPGNISWRSLARQYDRAQERRQRGDPTAMQVFYNERLGLVWDNTEGETTTAQQLKERADTAPRTLPDWALVVTIDCDTQKNRVEAQAHAWGPGLEHAVIDHQVFMGPPGMDPSDPASPWWRLDEYRKRPFAHASGAQIYASVTGIDSGGLNTQDVYNYGSARAHTGVVVHHGASRPGRPIIGDTPTKRDVDWNGKRIEGGVLLWMIGTDTAKDHLHNRYNLTRGWGAMHFSTALHLDWYEQLLAESPRLKRKPGGGYRRVWDKNSPGDRNEALDMAVGNLALAHHLRLHTWTPSDWAALRSKLVPAKPIVLAPAVRDPEPAAVPQPVSALPPVPVARRTISRGL
jgi:phage terminase large subunit GpA-like protein